MVPYQKYDAYPDMAASYGAIRMRPALPSITLPNHQRRIAFGSGAFKSRIDNSTTRSRVVQRAK